MGDKGAGGRARRGRGYSPRAPRAEKLSTLIITEGTVTEVQYLEGLLQHLRSTGTKVRAAGVRGLGKDPVKLIEAAKRGTEERDRYDHVWVVLDVDEHAKLNEALIQSASADIPVVVSNPCFEVWLIWHYEAMAKFVTTKDIDQILQRLTQTVKSIPSRFPFDQHAVASQRSGNASHTKIGRNPSSSMPALIAHLMSPKAE